MTFVELQDGEGNLIIWIDWITSVYQEDVGQKGKDLVFFVFTYLHDLRKNFPPV